MTCLGRLILAACSATFSLKIRWLVHAEKFCICKAHAAVRFFAALFGEQRQLCLRIPDEESVLNKTCVEKKMKAFLWSSLTWCAVGLLPVPLAHAQTDAEFAQAKAAYTLEDLQGDALCGEASILWPGPGGAIHKGFVKERPQQSMPGGLYMHPAEQDIRIHGMPLAGLIPGTNEFSVALVFKLPPKEIFSKLPGKPIMEEVRRFKEGNVEMIEWEQSKDRPHLMAFTWGDFTSVNCRRKFGFIAPPRKVSNRVEQDETAVNAAITRAQRNEEQRRAAEDMRVAKENATRQTQAFEQELKQRQRCTKPENRGLCGCLKYQPTPPGGWKTCGK